MKYRLLLSLLTVATVSLSQQIDREVLSTSGNSFANSNVQMDWTLGEMMILSFESSALDLTQGFHQPQLVITGIHETQAQDQIRIFPNPTKDIIYFEWPSTIQPGWVEVYDVAGRLLERKSMDTSGARAYIDMSAYSEGTYLMRFQMNQSKSNQFYKVIKN